MNKIIRRQLTLFVDETFAESIEIIRHNYNPEQSKLIKSHVTLCREDEKQPLKLVIKNLEENRSGCISIEFGPPIRFASGSGVFMPHLGENKPFHELRAFILRGVENYPRQHQPHITLMHPRNSICTDHIFEEIQNISLPQRILFRKISLLEQKDGGKWKILREFDLASF